MRAWLTSTSIVMLALLLCRGEVLAAQRSRAYKKLDAKTCALSAIEFDDGDSFSCAGEKIRLMGVDTPEIRHPDQGIMKDQDGGRAAAEFTRKALCAAQRIVVVRDGKGIYGRTLAHVIVDGELLGVKLIKAGLAYESVSYYGDNGMPEFALQILEAAGSSPRPSFEEPYRWRRKNQRK